MAEVFFVYILTNAPRNVFYVGVTNDLMRRVFEHKNKLVKGFSYRYNVDALVYYEMFGSVELAILHEKRVKRWARPIKCDAIQRMNPEWKDLYDDLTGAATHAEEKSVRHPGLVPGSPETNTATNLNGALGQEIPGQARDDATQTQDDGTQTRDDATIFTLAKTPCLAKTS
ncbi:MAG: GIY-YIG nuclease family protein [Alphaproteobacteria bacterium]|nr:GIY-YIG nuclease family protein [Alphaproteobacteria bacterium]